MLATIYFRIIFLLLSRTVKSQLYEILIVSGFCMRVKLCPSHYGKRRAEGYLATWC
jgi:hypothetical protein